MSRLLLACVALIAACAQSHEVERLGEDASATALNGDDSPAARSGPLCTRLAEIQCEGEQRCCSVGARPRADCERARQRACAEGLYLDRIAANPASGFDEPTADRVFTELARRVERCDPSILRWSSTEQGLRGIFRGTRGEAESCNPDGGLTSGPASIGTALALCRLDDGLGCQATGLFGDWTCAPKQARGQSCLTDDNCQPNDGCDNFGQAAVGTCVELLPLEAACEAPAQCDSLTCDDGVCTALGAEAVFCPDAE